MSFSQPIDASTLVNAIALLARDPNVKVKSLAYELWEAYPQIHESTRAHLMRLEKISLFNRYLDRLASMTDDRIASEFEAVRKTAMQPVIEELSQSCVFEWAPTSTIRPAVSSTTMLPSGEIIRLGLSKQQLNTEVARQLSNNNRYREYLLEHVTKFSETAQLHALILDNGRVYYLCAPHPVDGHQIKRAALKRVQMTEQIGPDAILLHHSPNAEAFSTYCRGFKLNPNQWLSNYEALTLVEQGVFSLKDANGDD